MQSFLPLLFCETIVGDLCAKSSPLRLAQVLEDNHHLTARQSARGTLVAHALKGREQTVGRGDVLVQQAQGRGARCAGEVELGELALGEGLNFYN